MSEQKKLEARDGKIYIGGAHRASVYPVAHDVAQQDGELWSDAYDRIKPLRDAAAIEAEELAALIVRAVNSHEALVTALEDCKRRIEESDEWWMDCPDRGGFDLSMIEAALALAKE